MQLQPILSHPQRLKQCTGFTLDQFNDMTARLEPLWENSEKLRLSRPDRKRAIGAGHPYGLKTTEEKLFCILLWYRTYPAFWFLGMVLGVDAATVCRLVNRLCPLLERAADPELKTYLSDMNRKRKKISSWEELKEAYPEIAEILIDATETPTVRPVKKGKQKKHYSGKKKHHTLKNQITASKNGKIIHVGKSVPGKKHDYQVFKEENVFKYLPPETKKYLDLGYDGVKGDFPDHTGSIRQAIKKRRNKTTLTRSEKIRNTKIAKQRITVEHIISWIKKYGILSQRYRNNFDYHNQDFRNIAALVNFRHGFAAIN